MTTVTQSEHILVVFPMKIGIETYVGKNNVEAFFYQMLNMRYSADALE